MSAIIYVYLCAKTGDELCIPGKHEVCPRCSGTGKHDHPAFSNGITGEEFNGPDWDDESRESYIRGDYDVACSECQGERVVTVPNLKSCDKEERDSFRRHEAAKRECQRDYDSERWLRYHESGVMG